MCYTIEFNFVLNNTENEVEIWRKICCVIAQSVMFAVYSSDAEFVFKHLFINICFFCKQTTPSKYTSTMYFKCNQYSHLYAVKMKLELPQTKLELPQNSSEYNLCVAME